MLAPDYFANTLNQVYLIYADLTTSTINAIAKRMAASLTDELTISATTRHQIMTLQESGMLREDVEAAIAKALNRSYVEVADAFDRAAVTSLRFDNAIYRAAGLPAFLIHQSETAQRILQASIEKANGSLTRLTGTITSSSEESLHTYLNRAYIETASGAKSYSQALSDACRDLVQDDIKTFDYTSGKHISIESAVLMNLRTGIAQTCGELTKQSMIEMGASYAQCSAHVGARDKGDIPDNHKLWQGAAYYYREIAVEPNAESLPDFVKTCGLGKATGINGINCRHSYSVWFPGQPLVYSESDLKKLAEKTYTYKGKTIGAYDASQKLRQMERNIRDYKRRVSTLESALSGVPEGIDTSDLESEISHNKRKVKEWGARYNDFCNETGLTKQPIRTRIFE